MAFLSPFTAKPPQLTFSVKPPQLPVRSSAATFPAKPQQQLPFPPAILSRDTTKIMAIPFLSRPPRSSSSVCFSRSSQAEKLDDENDLKPQQVDFLTKSLIAIVVVAVITGEFTSKDSKVDIGRMIKSLFNLMSGPPKPYRGRRREAALKAEVDQKTEADENDPKAEKEEDMDTTALCLVYIVVAVVLFVEFDKEEAETIDAESIGKVFKSKAKYILHLMGVEEVDTIDIIDNVLKEWRESEMKPEVEAGRRI